MISFVKVLKLVVQYVKISLRNSQKSFKSKNTRDIFDDKTLKLCAFRDFKISKTLYFFALTVVLPNGASIKTQNKYFN